MALFNFLFQEEFSSYGVDWDGPIPSFERGTLADNDVEGIEVPDILIPFSLDAALTTLNRIEPLGRSNNHGIDLYERTVTLLRDSGYV